MAVNNRSKVAYGFSEPLPSIFSRPIVAVRAPTSRDRAEVGQMWVDSATNSIYVLTSIVGGSSVWTSPAGGGGVFTSLTVQPGPTLINSTTVDIFGTDAVNDAVNIAATAGAGGVRIGAGTNGIGLNTTGAVNLDGLAPSHFTVAGGSLTLSTVGASTNVTSDTSVVIDGGLEVTIGTSADDGNIRIEAGVVNAAGAAAVLNSYMGIVTLTGLTTAAGNTELVTITCDKAIVTSGIICSASNFGANDAQMTVTRIENFAGSFEVTLTNNGSQALNGDLVLSFIVLN